MDYRDNNMLKYIYVQNILIKYVLIILNIKKKIIHIQGKTIFWKIMVLVGNHSNESRVRWKLKKYLFTNHWNLIYNLYLNYWVQRLKYLIEIWNINKIISILVGTIPWIFHSRLIKINDIKNFRCMATTNKKCHVF